MAFSYRESIVCADPLPPTGLLNQMGRHAKHNCDYYPHLTTMRNHRKIKALRNKFGSVLGYAFWSMFVEYLTELDHNKFIYSELECELFAAELGITVAEMKDMIDFCVKIELLVIENNIITSPSLNEKLRPVYDKRNRLKDSSSFQKRGDDGKFGNKTEATGISVTEKNSNADTSTESEEDMPQIKLNKIKLNKTKLNNIYILPLEERKKIFLEKVSEFGEKYSKIKLEKFFNYWAEHNENGKKMRFEKQKTFNLAMRLAQWKDFQNSKENSGNTATTGAASKNNEKIENIDYHEDNK